MVFFVGLDGEMTNAHHDRGELCQIGIASPDGDIFISDIRCTLRGADPEAMVVHGIDPGWLSEGAPEARVVDDNAAYWLTKKLNGKVSAIPVGWGVSYFDMPFVRRTLPGLSNKLSRRSVELGAVCYSIAATFGLNPDNVKRRAKKYAESRVTSPSTWHNAGFDAQAALYSWEYMQLVMKAGEYV